LVVVTSIASTNLQIEQIDLNERLSIIWKHFGHGLIGDDDDAPSLRTPVHRLEGALTQA
jgi:hypothetical protein